VESLFKNDVTRDIDFTSSYKKAHLIPISQSSPTPLPVSFSVIYFRAYRSPPARISIPTYIVWDHRYAGRTSTASDIFGTWAGDRGQGGRGKRVQRWKQTRQPIQDVGATHYLRFYEVSTAVMATTSFRVSSLPLKPRDRLDRSQPLHSPAPVAKTQTFLSNTILSLASISTFDN
jgi:hypothetical protein